MRYSPRFLSFYAVFLFVFFCAFRPNAEIRFVPLSQLSDFWEAESLFLGMGLFVHSAEDSVHVYYRSTDGNNCTLGELWFMIPGKHDSASFVFHNMTDSFPEENDSITLGRFPVGTPIVFRYVYADTSDEQNKRMYGMKVYSGQNRPGIEEYVSDLSGAASYRWAVAGQVLDSVCEMAFDCFVPGSFMDIRFLITNVFREERGKLTPATPVAEPASRSFTGVVYVKLSSFTYGYTRIHYTTDGSEPDTNDSVFSDSIPISGTTTLKAVACKPGDTLWGNSGIMSAIYTRDLTGLAAMVNGCVTAPVAGSAEYFDLYGRRIGKSLTSVRTRSANGILFVRDESKLTRARGLLLPPR